MPTYLYEHQMKDQIRPCGLEHEFEFDQGIKDDALKYCPDCSMPVKRLIAGGVSVQWKGQGPPTPNYHG